MTIFLSSPFLEWTAASVRFRTFTFLWKHCTEKDAAGVSFCVEEHLKAALLLHCIPTVSFLQSSLPEVNYGGPEWAFLPSPWAGFNYHPLACVNGRGKRGTASLAAVCKTCPGTAVHTKPLLCRPCCQAHRQRLDLADFIVCLERNSSSSVLGAIS